MSPSGGLLPEPIRAAAAEHLDVVSATVSLSAAARSGLMAALEARCAEALAPTLRLERVAARTAGFPVPAVVEDEASWQRRRSTDAALFTLVGEMLAGWRDHVSELVSRLSRDREVLGLGPDPLTIAAAESAGDPHTGGRSVVLLELSGGRGLVYKPKDLRVAARIQALLEDLNAAGFEPRLPTHAIVARESYGWEERVRPAPCRTPAEVEAFHRRFGSLLRLYQLLGARDLWMDNLIARGGDPLFVDLEMALQPRRSPSGEHPAERFLESSVLPTSMLEMIVPIAPGVGAEDLGALRSAGVFRTPYRADPELDALCGRSGEVRDGYRCWAHHSHAPTLMGSPVDRSAHAAAVESGYRAMHAFVLRHTQLVRAHLDALSPARVRVVHRSTWASWASIRAALTPAALAGNRATVFDPLAPPPAAPDRPIFDAEVRAWLRAEVPYFWCPVGDNAIVSDNGTRVDGPPAEGPLARAHRNLDGLASFELERHARIVRGLVAPAPLVPPTNLSALEQAAWLGDRLLDLAIGAKGSRAWVGRIYDPRFDVAPVGVLRDDLPTGVAGLAVVFAELHVAARRAAFREVALECCDAVELAPVGREADGLGLFGTGGKLRALARCAMLLDEANLAGRVHDWVAATRPEALAGPGPTDLLLGSAGLAAALRSLSSMPGRPAIHPLLTALSERIEEPSAPVPPAASRLEAFPGHVEHTADPLEPSAVWGLGAAIRARLATHEPALAPSLVTS